MSLLIRILAALQSCRLLGIFGVSASRLFEFRSGRAPDVAGEGGCVWFHASSQGSSRCFVRSSMICWIAGAWWE